VAPVLYRLHYDPRMTRYWLSIGDGKTYGPYTLADLRAFATQGKIASSSMVCPEGGSSWAPIASVLAEDGVPPPVFPPIAPPPVTGFPAQAQPHPDAKSKIAAGLLGIFLGALGVHNFYLGNTGLGLAQLLISLLSCGWFAPVCAIWGLIEGILILTGSIRTDARGIPLRD